MSEIDPVTMGIVQDVAWEYSWDIPTALRWLVEQASFLAQETRESGHYLITVDMSSGVREVEISRLEKVEE